MNKALSYQNYWYSTQPQYLDSLGTVQMFLLIQNKINHEITHAVTIPETMLNCDIPQFARDEIEKINKQNKGAI
tara:strand:+ start:180 stop:401 length:222 start_codon:yes stop_codon:yes gene_type:complete